MKSYSFIAAATAAFAIGQIAFAQSFITETGGNSIAIVDLETGVSSEYRAPDGGFVGRILGSDQTTGMVYASGVDSNYNQLVWEFDTATGIYRALPYNNQYAGGFDYAILPAGNQDLSWAEGMIQDEANAAASLSSVLDIAPPGEGQTNFLNFTANTMGGSDAYGVSYARNAGRWRLGAAYGRNERGDDAGKVSAGFGW